MTVLSSACEEDTRRAGAELARRLRPGDAVLLEGELGAGKTVFVKGLAEGLGLDPDDVSSPSFALVHEYGPAGRPPVLVHADLYRVAAGEGPSRTSDSTSGAARSSRSSGRDRRSPRSARGACRSRSERAAPAAST